MFAGESYHFGQPSHGAVFVGEFAQDGAGWQSREFCQIDTSFGVPSAFEYAAAAGRQREDVAGRASDSGRASGATAVRIVRMRSAAETPVVMPSAASIDTVNAVP